MEDKLKEKKEPSVTDLTIVVIEAGAFAHKARCDGYPLRNRDDQDC
jgi:hypothetical protein